ncbi:MAG: S8 family serine peptidase [Calditrichia bacterium]
MNFKWHTTFPLMLAVLLMLVFSAAAQDYADGRILVCFQPEVDGMAFSAEQGIVQTGLSSFDLLAQQFQIEKMEQWLASAGPDDRDGQVKLANIYRLYLPQSRSLEAAITAFSKNEWIVAAEYEPLCKPDVFLGPYTPNDPFMVSQWHSFKTMADWAWGTWTSLGFVPGDTSIVVGIVDSGVEWDHPDLMANIWVNPGEDVDGDHVVGDYGNIASGGDEDGIDNDGNGKVDDLIGWDFVGYDHNSPQEDNDPKATASDHGTAVSGCASAVTDNGLGVTGMGFRVKLLPCKVGADDGYQYLINGYDGILYAARTGADVINCSWGSTGGGGFGQNIINVAHDTYGAIIVASAGNENTNLNTTPHYPSDYNNVICVAGTDQDDSKNSSSNYGNSVDISAPFSSIYTTSFISSGGYQYTQGTSFSSPIVAGAIGLLKSMYPDSSQAWLENRIIESADNIDDVNPGYIGWLGSGRVNSFNAIAQPLYPNINFVASSMQILNDNGNGVLNPGEGASLRVTLKNETGWQNATNVSAELQCLESFVEITDSLADYGAINGGSVGINITDPFEFWVDSLAPNGEVNCLISLKAATASGTILDKEVSLTINIDSYQNGWPVSGIAYIQSSPLVFDADASPELEIFTGSNGGEFYGWDYLGLNIGAFPQTLGGQMWGSPALGDIDNDGDREIVIGSSTGNLYVIALDGTVEYNWTIGEGIYSTVSLADLDGDDDLEMIFGTFAGSLQVLNHDGTAFSGFPYPMGAANRVIGGCAVADLNGDGQLDIVTATQGREIYAFNSDGTVITGFPYTAGNGMLAPPVIADPDGAGPEGNRIIVGSQDGILHVVKSDGSVDFTYNSGSAIRGAAGLCDVDANGTVEIFFGNNASEITGLNYDGNLLPGFPLSAGGSIESQPVFSDLDGNGNPELIFSSLDGNLYAYDFQAAQWLAGFPSPMGGQIKSTPTIANIDGDADLEIACGTNNSLAILDVHHPNGSSQNAWFTYQGNFQRTGYYGDAVSSLAGEPGNIPLDFSLEQNYPNPFNPSTTIEYSLPESGHTVLEIFNILGEKVQTVIDQPQAAGRYRILVNGRKFASGIYFYRLSSGRHYALKRMLLLK